MKKQDEKTDKKSRKLRIKDPRLERFIELEDRDLEPLASVTGGAGYWGGGSPGVIQEL